MSSSFLHIATSIIPVYFGAIALLINAIGKKLGNGKLMITSYWLYLATVFVTTLTCGVGGVSIRAVESAPGINQFIVKTHAWTAALVFLISIAMLVFSVKLIRKKGNIQKSELNLRISSVIFLIVFIITVYFANRIR